jgi:hypothetical protein
MPFSFLKSRLKWTDSGDYVFTKFSVQSFRRLLTINFKFFTTSFKLILKTRNRKILSDPFVIFTRLLRWFVNFSKIRPVACFPRSCEGQKRALSIIRPGAYDTKNPVQMMQNIKYGVIYVAGAKLGGDGGRSPPRQSGQPPPVSLRSEKREKGPPLSFFRFAPLKSRFAPPSSKFCLRAWLQTCTRTISVIYLTNKLEAKLRRLQR